MDVLALHGVSKQKPDVLSFIHLFHDSSWKAPCSNFSFFHLLYLSTLTVQRLEIYRVQSLEIYKVQSLEISRLSTLEISRLEVER